MLLKYFYDSALAHASYMVGCQRSGTAIVIDPGRDIEQYLEAAQRAGLRLNAVAETHIHADYVSGTRELADRVGAKLYLSDEGSADWKYEYATAYDSKLVKDGDKFLVGNIKFTVMHTPGHTPESISFIVTDQGGGADKPMGIFTGDFVFVGSIGRPDLLEEAAGMVGTAESGARELFRSVGRFKELADYLQVWPAHGAGSACGKGLGAIPSTTVGYEKLFNPALQFDDEQAFVKYILADQVEAPKYFAVMKRVNKLGPKILGEAILLTFSDVSELKTIGADATVLDLTPSNQFATAHIPGSINIPTTLLSPWAGWLLDYTKPVYLICEPHELAEATRVLHKLGVDTIAGAYDRASVLNAGLATQGYRSASPTELVRRIEAGDVELLDVRSNAEWKEGHIAEASHVFLGHLIDRIGEIASDMPIVTQCKLGGRSAIAASVLQASGREVINMTGGYMAWVDEKLRHVKELADPWKTALGGSQSGSHLPGATSSSSNSASMK